MVFLPNLGVNRRDRLCGIPEYASAQSLDFLDLGQKSSFLNWKCRQVSIFKLINGWALVSFAQLCNYFNRESHFQNDLVNANS
jgi:hypothetical protein